MRAARVNTLGGPVVVEDVADPVPAPGEVVVDVAAAAVNFTDLLMSRGEYQISAEPPYTPGSELAGTVTEVGDGVDSFAIGDRVVGATLMGAFAQRAAVAAAGLSRVPEEVSLRDAAALLVAYGTAYSTLRSVAELEAGETAVVLGAAGGVGLAAVELATRMGARAIACASSPAKLAVCAQRGAAELVDYSREDLKARIKALTGDGADVVVDPVGGALSEPALRATRYGGRFVVVGFASGEIPRIPLNLVLLKGMDIRGFEIWGFRTHRPDDARRDHEELMALLASGEITPHISASYPLDQVGEALGEIAERRATGKVVVEP